MELRRWYAISGDRPSLGLEPTPAGTRYLIDTDPSRDSKLNPPRSLKERLRRLAGREPWAPWRGRAGFSAITEAWNGAVYASRFGASGSMIVFGGGHSAYFGSDVHAFDLASREWRRISDGYVAGADSEYGDGATYADAVYRDGSPLPPHTHDYVQYDKVGNDYILLKGQVELGRNVKAVAIPHLFNLDTLSWRHGPRHPTAILNSGGWTTWDAPRRVLWGHSGDDGGGNAFIGFRPDGANSDGTFGRWTDCFPNKLPGSANYNAMQIDPSTGLLIVAVHRRNELYAIDPNAPDREIVRLESQGEKPTLHPCAALEYAPAAAALAYFSPLDAGIVHFIASSGEPLADAASARWNWRACKPVTGSLNPVAHARELSRYPVNLSQTFGRFRIASYGASDVAILVRHIDSPVYALRLT